MLAALANGVALVALSIWIFYEAFQRFRDPPEVLGGWMLVLGGAGIAVNIAAGAILSRARRGSLNVEAAFRHVFADLLGSVGVVVAAAVILTTGWLEADPLVSVLIGVLVLVSSWSILRDSTTILLEAAPSGIDTRAVGERLRTLPASWRCTTCTSGRSRRVSRRSPRTCWSAAVRTVMRDGWSSPGCSRRSSGSSTRRFRSTTSASEARARSSS